MFGLIDKKFASTLVKVCMPSLKVHIGIGDGDIEWVLCVLSIWYLHGADFGSVLWSFITMLDECSVFGIVGRLSCSSRYIQVLLLLQHVLTYTFWGDRSLVVVLSQKGGIYIFRCCGFRLIAVFVDSHLEFQCCLCFNCHMSPNQHFHIDKSMEWRTFPWSKVLTKQSAAHLRIRSVIVVVRITRLNSLRIWAQFAPVRYICLLSHWFPFSARITTRILWWGHVMIVYMTSHKGTGTQFLKRCG